MKPLKTSHGLFLIHFRSNSSLCQFFSHFSIQPHAGALLFYYQHLINSCLVSAQNPTTVPILIRMMNVKVATILILIQSLERSPGLFFEACHRLNLCFVWPGFSLPLTQSYRPPLSLSFRTYLEVCSWLRLSRCFSL